MNWAIDVSSYDSRRYVYGRGYVCDLPINWQRARNEGGLSLAIIKCSEGLHRDPAFGINWEDAQGVLPKMAYHFIRSNVNMFPQAEQLQDLLSTDSLFDKSTDRLIVDFETQDGVAGDACLAKVKYFMYEMEKWGTLPLLYTYPSFWRSIGGEKATWAAGYPLCLAQWPMDNWAGVIKVPPYLFTASKLADLKAKIASGELKPMALKPWIKPAIWQFTARADARAIPGHPAIKTAVDYSAVYMPLDCPDVRPPVVVGSKNGLYKCDASVLKIFTGPGDIYKQSTSYLRNGQIVTVKQIILSRGEYWAEVELPSGWVRAMWLSKWP
jgi:hypothetical protein